MVFDAAIQRVKIRAEMNETSMSYKIPHYMLGRPMINAKHAARYVTEKLRIYGYKAVYRERDGTYVVDVDWSLTPVTVEKKPRDVRRVKKTATDVKTNPEEAVRRIELIKAALKNSMSR
jgi:hypothetical protein